MASLTATSLILLAVTRYFCHCGHLRFVTRNSVIAISHHSSLFTGVNLINVQHSTLNFSKHLHSTYHIGLITQGTQSFNAKGKNVINGPGQLQLMDPGITHDGSSNELKVSSKIFSISVSAIHEFLDQKNTSLLTFSDNCIEDQSLYSIFSQLHTHMATGYANTLWLESAFLSNLALLATRYGHFTEPKVYCLGRSNLAKLNAFMHEHIAEKLTVSRLANECNLTDIQLLRQFKALTGITPFAWLLRIRLETALQLLHSGIRSTDVAMRVGFYDQAHFINAFKRAYGIKPSELY